MGKNEFRMGLIHRFSRERVELSSKKDYKPNRISNQELTPKTLASLTVL
jgi:hypothetical protein